MRALRMIRRATRSKPKRPRPRPSADIDRGLLADVEHLAEVVAETIGRLHAARRGEIARPLEEALGRLGKTR